MKVTYAPTDEQIATEALPENTSLFGYDFVGSKPVDVTNPAHLRKFSGHPHFKVAGTIPADGTVRTAAERESAALGAGSSDTVTGVAKDAPTVKPVSDQPQTGPDKVTPGQADKPDGDSDLRAVHRGRGSYSVVQGDKDEEVVGGLSTEEAEDFNILDADAKAKRLADLAG